MLSQEAELALARLAEGAVLNTLHTTSRELIEAGFASSGWGKNLEITEAGRVWVRKARGRRFEIQDGVVADLSGYQNPMGLGPEIPAAQPGQWLDPHDHPQVPAAVTEVLARPIAYYDRATRAAGIASGKTGEWPTSEWVQAFMDAFEEGEHGVE